MKRLFLAIKLTVLIVGCARAQGSRTFNMLNAHTDSTAAVIKPISFASSIGQDGRDIYLNRAWQHSTIITLDDDLISVGARYNATRGAIEVSLGDEIRILNQRKLKAIKIGKHTLVPFLRSEIRDMDYNAYFDILAPGAINLYAHYEVDIRSTTGSDSFTLNTPDGDPYIRRTLYYSKRTGKVEQLFSARKKVLELFGRYRKRVEKYAAENKIKFRNAEDLEEIFEYYNSLIR